MLGSCNKEIRVELELVEMESKKCEQYDRGVLEIEDMNIYY